MDKKIITDNLAEQAYQLIRESIINKEFSPGMRLVDSSIAEQLGISRTPCRDAIRKLAAEGLVVPVGRKGFAVVSPTEKDVYEIYAFRELIEKSCIQKLIQEIIPKDPEVIEKIGEAYRRTVEPGITREELVEAAESFHLSIVEAVNNSRITSAYQELLAQTRVFRCTTYSSMRVEEHEASQHGHENIYLALKECNLDKAMAALKEHNEVAIRIDMIDVKRG